MDEIVIKPAMERDGDQDNLGNHLLILGSCGLFMLIIAGVVIYFLLEREQPKLSLLAESVVVKGVDADEHLEDLKLGWVIEGKRRGDFIIRKATADDLKDSDDGNVFVPLLPIILFPAVFAPIIIATRRRRAQKS